MSIQSGTSPGAIISSGDTPAGAAVTSVFGRIGAVVAVLGDYTSSLITNASTVVGATVTAALDTLNSGKADKSIVLTAGAGLTGGGDLSANRTFDVVANADGSIIVNANDIQVGVLATDAQHGVRGGGTQHAIATTLVAGFLSAADKLKLDGITPGAAVTSVFGRVGAVVAVLGDYTSSLITNLSTVAGATVTDALNALNSITPSAVQDIYLATTGNDANPGTIASPVLTLAGAYSKLRENATLPVIHVATGTYAWAPIPIPLTIIGDGAGQGADTGFTTVATGASAAGTTALQLTLGGAVAVNLYRGLTLEWRSGAANGHRLSVRDNTATVVTPVEVAGFPGSVINPGVGSNFAILRPSVIFTTTATEISGTVEIADALNSSREYTPAAIVNVRFTMSSATVRGVIASSSVRMFGVEVNPGTFYLVDAQVDGGYVVPEASMNAWAIRVGLTGFAQITNWIGWGVTWPAAVAADASWLVNNQSLLRGMFVFGAMTPSSLEAGQDGSISGTIEINGGSALGAVSLFYTRWIQGNFNIRFTCANFLCSIGSYAQVSGMQCTASAGSPFTLEWDSICQVVGDLVCQGNASLGGIVRRGGRLFVRSFGLLSFVGLGSTGLDINEASRVVVDNVATCTFTGIDSGLRIFGKSEFACFAGGTFTVTGTSATVQAIDINEDSSFTLEIGTLSATGVAGGLRVRQNSKFTTVVSTFTLAASSSGSGVECSGGSSCYFPGGAGNTITGLGAANFGVNCRGGGRAFFLNAPPATVTGPAGDLTVGTGGGDTIASAALATSFSAVVAGASAIARAS